jgi:UPF0755 protein
MEEKGRHEMNWRILYSIILLIAWIGIGYLYIDYSLDSPKREKDILITIPEKSSAKRVGEILVENKMINQNWFFTYYLRFKGIDIKAGEYGFSPTDTLDDVLKKLSEGKQEGIKVIIPPGKHVLGIAEILEEKGFDGQGFLEALKNRKPKYDFEKQIPDNDDRYYKLEGYLIPDTYFFHKSETPEEIVEQMLAPFDEFIKKYEAKINGKSMFQNKPFTIDQMVTIASLVEREAREKVEYGKVSGVIYNRLNKPDDPNFKRLRIDATNVFANDMEGKKYKRVDQMNSLLDSPYNTYLYDGLPPGPIASPSREAMEAAIQPEEHDYYYYTAKYDGSGLHYFAKTYQEHLKYIEQSRENAKEGKGI